MIMQAVPFARAACAIKSPRSLRRRGMGDLNFGGNGIISCGGIDQSLCNADSLQQIVAYSQGRPLSKVNSDCNIGGVSGSGCVGYLQSAVNWLQQGNVIGSSGNFSWCGPGTGTWNGPVNSTCTPTSPSPLAASQAAAANAASPLSGGGKFFPTVPTVYTTNQPAYLSSPAPPQPGVVNPSPPTQSTAGSTVYATPGSVLNQTNGTMPASSDLVSTVMGYLSGSDATQDIIPGVPNWIPLGIGGGAILLLLLSKKR